MYKVENKKELFPNFIGKITSLKIDKFKDKNFVVFHLQHRDRIETVSKKFEVFETRLVNEIIAQKFLVGDYMGVIYHEIKAANSTTGEIFTKNRVTETFLAYKPVNMSQVAWDNYSKQQNKTLMK